jgi:hypothetical protein
MIMENYFILLKTGAIYNNFANRLSLEIDEKILKIVRVSKHEVGFQ